jgi:hypothetical protein
MLWVEVSKRGVVAAMRSSHSCAPFIILNGLMHVHNHPREQLAILVDIM